MFRDAFPILYASDVERVAAFYRDGLGFHETYRYPGEGEAAFVALRLGEASLGVGRAAVLV